TVRLWDVGTGQPVGEPFEGHTGWVNSVSFSPDNTHIVSGSGDKTIRLWEVATGRPAGEPFVGHTEEVNSVSFSPDGTRIGASHHDRTLTSALPGEDGWITGPNRRLLFWIPPASREPFYNPRTALVIPRGGVELDLSDMAHGTRWQHCYEE
ncbi:WD40 repeat-like protein, partial [Suillus decipiens]